MRGGAFRCSVFAYDRRNSDRHPSQCNDWIIMPLNHVSHHRVGDRKQGHRSADKHEHRQVSSVWSFVRHSLFEPYVEDRLSRNGSRCRRRQVQAVHSRTNRHISFVRPPYSAHSLFPDQGITMVGVGDCLDESNMLL